MKQSTPMEIEENDFPNNKFLLHYDNSFNLLDFQSHEMVTSQGLLGALETP